MARNSIQYTDLVELLKTRFINPAYPQGEAIVLLESIRASYRYLKTLLVDTKDTKVKFAKLIEFLNKPQPLVPRIDYSMDSGSCPQRVADPCAARDFTNWVYCYFERIGQLIVLESGEGPQLPFEGKVFGKADQLLFTLRKDGTIIDTTGNIVARFGVRTVLFGNDSKGGFVGPTETVSGKTFVEQFGDFTLAGVVDGLPEPSVPPGRFFVTTDGLFASEFHAVQWLLARDTCDLEKVRLTHLDGSALLTEEYDRIQRFIRLWHKTGWTIDETDQALMGLSRQYAASNSDGDGTAADCNFVTFDSFQDTSVTTAAGQTNSDCCSEVTAYGTCPDIASTPEDISSGFIHQLVAVRKLMDLTGLPLDKLLAFWGDIGTAGENSLYSRLLLTHNILGIDKVFQSDKNGNFLTSGAKISGHLPVLMAALKMTANDISAIIEFRKLSDDLNLRNISALYRHSLLAKLLHVPVASLGEIVALLGDPFLGASNALSLLTDWGNMEDAGFTFRQLNYIVNDRDDSQRPLAPSAKTILLVAKTLYDGLNAIDLEHQDIAADKKDAATDDLVRSKAGLIYEASVAEQIIGLLDGTTTYTTNAPANQVIMIPAMLTGKLTYSNRKDAVPPSAAIQVAGILTDTEAAVAKAISPLPGWSNAIDRIGKQPRHFFTDVLFGIFPDTADAAKNLLSGDVNLPQDPKNLGATDANTSPKKRFYFLQGFCRSFASGLHTNW